MTLVTNNLIINTTKNKLRSGMRMSHFLSYKHTGSVDCDNTCHGMPGINIPPTILWKNMQGQIAPNRHDSITITLRLFLNFYYSDFYMLQLSFDRLYMYSNMSVKNTTQSGWKPAKVDDTIIVCPKVTQVAEQFPR